MKLHEMEQPVGSPLAATSEHGSNQRERSIGASGMTWASIRRRLSLPSIITWSLVGVLLLFCYHTKNSARSVASVDASSSTHASTPASVGP